jgi:hypothetical protein
MGALLASTVPTVAQAQLLADPRVAWQTADSAHFRVHYREGQRAQAEAVARAAERVYPRITQALQWQPRTRTEIVVYTELDLANGYTTPLPFNLIGVFLAPPDEGQLLDNSAWLDLLLVHEFTHAVHLDKVRGAPKVLQAIFGNIPWFIPNLFQPGWALEGLAVYNESEPEAGRGRLKGPMFEAWLRAERASGFLSLREINSDGRALPLSKQYLYGAYFYEFLARRYGGDKVQAYVEQYSGNIVPRLHSNPVEMTGKTMDVLWEEFLADLRVQVDDRSAASLARPEVVGERLAGPLFDISAVAALPGGALLAVVEDGMNGALLTRFNGDGSSTTVTRVNSGARLDVAADGRVLVAQPDVCHTLYYAYDLYRLDGNRLQQLSDCAHLRRAVYAGPDIVALRLDAGSTQLVKLGAAGGEITVLNMPPAGTDYVDLAAAPDGRRVSVISHRGGDWQLLEFDLAAPAAPPKLLLRRNAPMHSLRQGAAGLEVVAAVDGVYDVWRLQGGELRRLTATHTAVVTQAGTAADGSLASVVIAPQGFALHRLAAAAPLQSQPAETTAAAAPPETPAAAPETALGEGRSYSALRSVYPRSWLPAITADRGLTAYGASTSGGDALGWHQYTALLMWETSQKEPLGALEYVFVGSHGLALSRSLTARSWTGGRNDETTTVYDRRTQAQWLSLLPLTRVERRINFGVGAAMDRLDRVDLLGDTTTRPRDERIVAALADLDTSGQDWASEGPNRGLHTTLLYESYKPFSNSDKAGAPDYSGGVLRADLRGFVPLGRNVLALRWTEAHANGTTVPFQLGGATDKALQIGYVLNNRELALRGYGGDEPELRGRNARVASVELRTPLADIDRHAMVPPFGINRLSAAVFVDSGGAWDTGSGPAKWRTGVGVELLAEVKLLYALGLQLRLGVAQGLDEPRSTHGYLTVGRAF